MSEQPKHPRISAYYKRYWTRFRQEIRKAVWKDVMAIFATIAVLFVQFYFGLIKKDQTLSSALVNIAPATLVLVLYVAYHVIRTPWLLDSERQNEISSGLESIERLKLQIEEFSSETTRPKFKIGAVVEPLDEFDEDLRNILTIEPENNGSRDAFDIECQAILVDEDPTVEPKIVGTSIASEVEVNNSFTLRAEIITTSPNEPALVIVCTLKYSDAVTGKLYRQIFYRKWDGMKHGEVQSVHPLTIPERDALKARLKNYIAEFVSDNDQNVGSIPSSKID